MTTESQSKAIRNHLVSGKSLTPIEALKLFGCLRLSGRVHDIRNGRSVKQLNIEKKIVEVGKAKKRVAQYFAPIGREGKRPLAKSAPTS